MAPVVGDAVEQAVCEALEVRAEAYALWGDAAMVAVEGVDTGAGIVDEESVQAQVWALVHLHK